MREHVLPGDAACPGCPIPIGLKTVAAAFNGNAVLVIPACCTSVVVGTYPYSSLKMNIVHTPFASSASVASGLREALKQRGLEDTQVIVWAGDGGTADIGMASLSGAAERNEDIIYIMYDNEAYMNTGIQRSSSTPIKAWTTTTPVYGKSEPKKDVARIMIAHNVPYVATASIAYPQDLYQKLKKAQEIRGFRFIQLHSPCPVGWRFDASKTVEVARLAVETGMWILYEYFDNKLRVSGPSMPVIKEGKIKPIEDYIKIQRRFSNINGEGILEIQRMRDNNIEWIKKLL
ncbi:3-methyl-2-oxobutanoate dehydrogenase subunit beta [Fervidicoccus fontis]|uniref:2-oxoacid oxidoreductase (ferredoxin) n=1 Tax=Fervidicoccus fontis (strain DSM 19380 / JCM 18336 / VKM B-2539 / Kam940) TaxID=1163730 RepID=I0A009_FERFK|nr:3-methyl-2-oxobutanoate dehydrogenase subunit beta [Fervidicoccus fontis]AFH42316.1 2-oxoacid:ferredoxin oxidoreductase, beta subunit [Fervidicoccus fontis Kam940]